MVFNNGEQRFSFILNFLLSQSIFHIFDGVLCEAVTPSGHDKGAKVCKCKQRLDAFVKLLRIPAKFSVSFKNETVY